MRAMSWGETIKFWLSGLIVTLIVVVILGIEFAALGGIDLMLEVK